MNREEALKYLSGVDKWPNCWRLYGWDLQDGQYVHAMHDPITIDDWNRAKIVPNTKVRILSPEHSEYVQKLAFEAGVKWRDTGCSISALPTDSVIFFLKNNIMLFNSLREAKEIFIELPAKDESIKLKPMHENLGMEKSVFDEALKESFKHEAPEINARV